MVDPEDSCNVSLRFMPGAARPAGQKRQEKGSNRALDLNPGRSLTEKI